MALAPKTNRKHANKTQKSNPKQANLAYVHLEELLPPPQVASSLAAVENWLALVRSLILTGRLKMQDWN